VLIVLEAIRDKVPVVLQEAVVVVQTIFRRYPNKYESIISDVCTNLDEIDEPGAKAALIWVIGEYSDRIDAAEELLEVFFESYSEEESQVQLALLTALSKLYLNVESDKSVDMLQELLGITNDTVDDPDVRDRALFYWRVIAGDLDVARQVILAPKAPIESKILEELDPKLLSILAKRISCASSVFFKRPSAFVSYKNLYACPNEFKDTGVLHGEGDEPAMEQKPFQNGHSDAGGSSEREGEKKEEANKPPPVDLLGDLLSLDVVTPSTTAPPTQVPIMPMQPANQQIGNNFFTQQQQQQQGQGQGHGFFQETQAFPQAGEAAFPKPTNTNTNSNNPFF